MRSDRTARVVAVVVTHNRRDHVGATLDSLLAQSHPPERIVVVDNASTDGTGAALEARYDGCGTVELIAAEQNLGGAGGFEMGMRRAMRHRPDWLWTMDDDVAADPEALEELLSWGARSRLIQPARRAMDGTRIPWETRLDPVRCRRHFLADRSFAAGRDHARVNVACFEGMLIAASLVEEIGYPDPRFFIAGDDAAYGLLASRHTDVLYTSKTYLQKTLPAAPQIRLLGRRFERMGADKAYYFMRNRFLLARYFAAFGAPRRARAAYLVREAAKSAFKGAVLFRDARYLYRLALGLRDGLRGRFGP